MQKFLIPADKVLTEIGRFVLLRPLLSACLLTAITGMTLWNNFHSHSEATAPTSSFQDTFETHVPLPTDSSSTFAGNPVLQEINSETSLLTHQIAKEWLVLTIHSADTLSGLFKKHGFSAQEVAVLARLAGAKALQHLKPGQEIRLHKNEKGELQQLAYAINDQRTLWVERIGKTYKAHIRAIPINSLSTPSNTPDASSPGLLSKQAQALPEVPTPATPAQKELLPTAKELPPAAAPSQKTGHSPSLVVKGVSLHKKTLTLHAKDTLSKVLKNQGISSHEIGNLLKTKNANRLAHLKVGQEIHLYKDAQDQLWGLTYAIDAQKTFVLFRSAKGGYQATTQMVPINSLQLNTLTGAEKTSLTPPLSKEKAESAPLSPEKTAHSTPPPLTSKPESIALSPGPAITYASGRIKRSLLTDAKQIGLTASQASQLSRLFNQKSALAHTLRVGDEFRVLYEKSNGKKGGGNILAAQVTTRGKTYRLIRFTDPKGRTAYYTPEGESLQEGISRAPLHFARISSHFSNGRLHPILGYRRAHTGVDYSAPYGTPVRAAGDGVLTEMGYQGGYGKAITIHHTAQYATLYGHLSRFGNYRPGRHVQKGDVIGYVGSTGLSSGPHLHFEIRVNNRPMNPLTVALPGSSVPRAYRKQFFLHSRALLAQLKNGRSQVHFAQKKEDATRS